jgi:hypothetical protein
VERPRDQLLARSGFALDQNGGIEVREALDEIDDVPHARRVRSELTELDDLLACGTVSHVVTSR